MINENVKKWLDEKGLGDRLMEHKAVQVSQKILL